MIPILIIYLIEQPLIQIGATVTLMGISLILKLTNRITLSYLDTIFSILSQLIYLVILIVYLLIELEVVKMEDENTWSRIDTLLVSMLAILVLAIISYIILNIAKLFIALFVKKRAKTKVNSIIKGK